MTCITNNQPVQPTDVQIINVSHNDRGAALLQGFKNASTVGGNAVNHMQGRLCGALTGSAWFDSAVITIPASAASCTASMMTSQHTPAERRLVFDYLAAVNPSFGAMMGQAASSSPCPALLMTAVGAGALVDCLRSNSRCSQLIINDSNYALSFSASSVVGAAPVSLPSDRANAVVVMPPRDDAGNVAALLLQFEMNSQTEQGTYHLAYASQTLNHMDGQINLSFSSMPEAPFLRVSMADEISELASAYISMSKTHQLTVYGALNLAGSKLPFALVYVTDQP